MTTRELTAEERELRAEECHHLNEQVKVALRGGRASAWKLAQALHEFDEAAGWTALGHETIGHWLADPEIGLSKSVYYRLIKGYRTLTTRRVPEARMLELEPSKLELVLPAIESGERTVDDALNDVESLGWRDLREAYVAPKRDKSASTKSDGAPVPGETPGYPVDAETGEPLDLSDEQHEALAQHELDPEAVTGEVVPADPTAELEQALEAWEALRAELLEVAASGQSNPRIVGRLIAPGVSGVDLIFRRGGIEFDDAGLAA